MIRLVIAANGENRAVAQDDAARTFEGLEFGSFDIHFDKGDAFAGENVIEANAGNLSTRSGGDASPADTIPGEMDNSVVSADRGPVKCGSIANTVQERLQTAHDGWVGLESNHFAKAIAGLGNEGLDRVSGVGSAIDEALAGGHGKQAGKVLVARGRDDAVKVRAQSQLELRGERVARRVVVEQLEGGCNIVTLLQQVLGQIPEKIRKESAGVTPKEQGEGDGAAAPGPQL